MYVCAITSYLSLATLIQVIMLSSSAALPLLCLSAVLLVCGVFVASQSPSYFTEQLEWLKHDFQQQLSRNRDISIHQLRYIKAFVIL